MATEKSYAYVVKIKADQFLNGKRKVQAELDNLDKNVEKTTKHVKKNLDKSTESVTQFGKAASSAFKGAYVAAAGFLGIGAGLVGLKSLFTSTASEITRASNQANFFGSNVNKLYGVKRGFEQAGLNGDNFIGASGQARMALANIADPTIFGGLSGGAQQLLQLGARTGININNLGDPNKALGEFSKYGKGHSKDQLAQLLAAAGFDPGDASKIKSGELKELVDTETKKSNITKEQVKTQENLNGKMIELGQTLEKIGQDLAIAFGPDLVNVVKDFSDYLKDHKGDIVGFFQGLGDATKGLSELVGGLDTLLNILNPVERVRNGTATGFLKDTSDAVMPVKQAVHDAWGYVKDSWGSGGIMGTAHADGHVPSFVSGHALGQAQASTGLDWNNPEHRAAILDGLKQVESNGNDRASSKNTSAKGGYQFTDGTAKELGLKIGGSKDERFDPVKSRAAAERYLDSLHSQFGNIGDAIQAYHDGAGNVRARKAGKHNKVIDSQESLQYLPKVMHQANLAQARRGGYTASGSTSTGSTTSTHINTVVVNSNPSNVDQLTADVKRKTDRSVTNASFSSSMR